MRFLQSFIIFFVYIFQKIFFDFVFKMKNWIIYIYSRNSNIYHYFKKLTKCSPRSNSESFFNNKLIIQNILSKLFSNQIIYFIMYLNTIGIKQVMMMKDYSIQLTQSARLSWIASISMHGKIYYHIINSLLTTTKKLTQETYSVCFFADILLVYPFLF